MQTANVYCQMCGYIHFYKWSAGSATVTLIRHANFDNIILTRIPLRNPRPDFHVAIGRSFSISLFPAPTDRGRPLLPPPASVITIFSRRPIIWHTSIAVKSRVACACPCEQRHHTLLETKRFERCNDEISFPRTSVFRSAPLCGVLDGFQLDPSLCHLGFPLIRFRSRTKIIFYLN